MIGFLWAVNVNRNQELIMKAAGRRASPNAGEKVGSEMECLLNLLTVITVDLKNAINLIVKMIALFAWPMKIVDPWQGAPFDRRLHTAAPY